MSTTDERLREIEASAVRKTWKAAGANHLELSRSTDDSRDCADAPLLAAIERAGVNGDGDGTQVDYRDEPTSNGEEIVEPEPSEDLAAFSNRLDAITPKGKSRKRKSAGVVE